jgi:predicted dehydrogenase
MASTTRIEFNMDIKKSSLRVGIVGIGHRGYNTHFLSILENSRAWNVSAVCDVNEEVRTRFSTNHPEVPSYSSIDDLLSKNTLDFAIVCVPHRSHLECCTILANVGVPILKEKPVVESLEEYQQLCNLPVKIGITFQKRFEPRYLALQNLLPQIGQVADTKTF